MKTRSGVKYIEIGYINEVEYVGKRQIVKIEQLATKKDNNNLKHIFIVAYILGREVLENSSGRTV